MVISYFFKYLILAVNEQGTSPIVFKVGHSKMEFKYISTLDDTLNHLSQWILSWHQAKVCLINSSLVFIRYQLFQQANLQAEQKPHGVTSNRVTDDDHFQTLLPLKCS